MEKAPHLRADVVSTCLRGAHISDTRDIKSEKSKSEKSKTCLVPIICGSTTSVMSSSHIHTTNKNDLSSGSDRENIEVEHLIASSSDNSSQPVATTLAITSDVSAEANSESFFHTQNRANSQLI